MDIEPVTSFAFEKVLQHRSAAPSERRLEVVVVYTSVQMTLRALRTAAELATRLDASITLLVPQQVPYPLPLTSPPVLLDFSERRFRTLASLSPVETRVKLYLCRDTGDALARTLPPRSIVLLGAARTWWPAREKRLARRLRRSGHEVIVVEKE